MRDAATVLGEREGIISSASIHIVSKNYVVQKIAFSQSTHSNNPLAVKPETENDAAR
jgi:hypothetical protein